jgi:ADP-heptose:LPS heptosyltransferase
MKYFRHSPIAKARLQLIDWAYQLCSAFRQILPMPSRYQRILIANPAHLGDAVITTAVIRELKKQHPQLSIDVLCGSWSSMIFRNHPAIDQVFTLDLPMLNRSKLSNRAKEADYLLGFQSLKSSVVNRHYDLVASLYAYEPSYIPALHQLVDAPIVGFSSAGYGPLLTKSFNTADMDWHEAQHQAKVLEDLLGEPKSLEAYQVWLEQGSKTIAAESAYLVLHPGTGDPSKEWTLEAWQEVIRYLCQSNIRIVLTGHGEREEQFAQKLINGSNQCQIENRVGKLSFSQFCQAIAGAKLLVSLESVAAHIASAYQVPSLIAAFGKTNLKRWQPLGGCSQLIDMRQDAKASKHLFFECLQAMLDEQHIVPKEGSKTP